MPGQKRKRQAAPTEAIEPGTKKASRDEVATLESAIRQSRQNYNNIPKLILMAKKQDSDATVALCRVFSRLLAGGDLKKSKDTADSELVIAQWLREQYSVYTNLLLGEVDPMHLSCMMRLTKEEVKEDGESAWKRGLFGRLVEALLSNSTTDSSRREFVREWIRPYDDARFYLFQAISQATQTAKDGDHVETAAQIYIDVLSSMGDPPESNGVRTFLGNEPSRGSKHPLRSVAAHKKQAQDAWLRVLRAPLTKPERKMILSKMDRRIVPWFAKTELLMDFLTDSYNVGGSSSLLALSGLFYLIQQRNLDYPSFYPKLYSLLDSSLLHSKHRSMFLRLLAVFMSSTHLPSALVASFIKRLSRLALYAPPGAIVAIVPLVYNLLKKHPMCTFMVHRAANLPHERTAKEMQDPFDVDELDPMETGALGSSLWEIETLQSHYHPNVASIARIISTQFTKQSYNVEDFLDHSYEGLIESELSRNIKKTPVVEFEIPKRIFSDANEEYNETGRLFRLAMRFEKEEHDQRSSAP